MKVNKSISRNVLVLGVVSFFNDVASEMVYPIVPIFLTSVLKASMTVVGLIEGIAEATAAITKFFFGFLSDRWGKRKPFVTLGYFISAVSKGLMGLAGGWFLVLVSRFLDRFGKGLRTAPRDALLLQNTDSKNKGYVFGFHRSLDSAGAVVGPILALVLVYFFANNLRIIFYLATIPALFGVLLLVLLVKEKTEAVNAGYKLKFSIKELDSRIVFFIFVTMVFALGNSSDAFLILRAKGLGLSVQLSILAYVLYNLVYTLASTPLGKFSDKIGHKKMFSFGLLVFSLVYFLFASVKSGAYMWILFPVYGVYIAATDGVAKAYLGDFIKEGQAGSVYGLYQMILALATFFASWFGGLLWTKIDPSATFYYGTIMSLLAFLLLMVGKFKYKI